MNMTGSLLLSMPWMKLHKSPGGKNGESINFLIQHALGVSSYNSRANALRISRGS